MTERLITRRELLRRTVWTGAAGAVFAACGSSKPKELACTDTAGLSAAETQMRTSLAYVDASTQAGKNCTNCQLFQPAAAADQCGKCVLVKGPINPKGYCNSWAQKAS